jgi:hypothetical protein
VVDFPYSYNNLTAELPVDGAFPILLLVPLGVIAYCETVFTANAGYRGFHFQVQSPFFLKEFFFFFFDWQ